MNIEKPKGEESSVSKNTSSDVRRTFLKRATAGAVVASISGRSAWAGIASSIVASGHGSDFNQGVCTKLLTAQQLVDNGYGNQSFIDIFLGTPFDMNGVPEPTNNNGVLISYTLSSMLTNTLGTTVQEPNIKGINDVNIGLMVMYLNAVNHRNNEIFYPVLAQHQNDRAVFASYLYQAAKLDAGGTGTTLSNAINNNSGDACQIILQNV